MPCRRFTRGEPRRAWPGATVLWAFVGLGGVSGMCTICLKAIPEERDDTIIWQDVRFAISQDERGGLGPFFAAHPDCFELVKPGTNGPCPGCGAAIAPIQSEVPKRGRWACVRCHREFEEGLLGRLKEVSPPAPIRHRPGAKYLADRIEDLKSTADRLGFQEPTK